MTWLLGPILIMSHFIGIFIIFYFLLFSFCFFLEQIYFHHQPSLMLQKDTVVRGGAGKERRIGGWYRKLGGS